MSICMTDPDPPRTMETASSFHEHMSLKYCFHCITAYYTEVLILLRQSHVIKILWYQEYSFQRLFVPWNIRSHDGTFVLGTIRSLEHSFPGPFVPWNFRSQDYSFPGTFVPWTIRSMELSFPGTFVPGTLDLSCRGPFLHLSAEQYLVWNSVTNRSVVL